jgi:CheY-like chemotaxis protein
MNLKTKALSVSITFSLLFYLADSIIDKAMTYENMSFLQVFITAPPYQELYSRLFGICLIMILGIILPTFLEKSSPKSNAFRKENKISANPYLMVSVSNQLRTPLNAIQGFVGLLNEAEISETSKRLYINHIKTSNNYMLELINNISDITLIESGSLYLKEEESKINGLLILLQDQFKLELKDKNKSNLDITLTTENADENFSIHIDPNRLKQVFENLLKNAIAFSRKGKIEFGYKNINENTYEFFVKDTGDGLSEERLDMIYSQNSTVIDNRMTPFDIVSLRINLAKHLVKTMGGELIAKSKTKKVSGFTFQLKVNVIQKPAEEKEILEKQDIIDETKLVEAVEKLKKWSDKTILIAEDVETNFIYLREILSETDIKILWAQNGKIACKYAASNPEIDLVLMDILMPEMDGIEAAKTIKKKLPDLPIIAQTAYHLDKSDYDDANHYFEKYLIKPIWSNDLLTALQEYLS